MLTQDTKRIIYQLLATPDNFIQNDDGFAVINKVWRLRDLTSEDSRYKDAYGDFRQHIINNADWEIDFIFLDRLNLLSGPESVFLKFIESFLDPEIRKEQSFIEDYARRISSELEGTGLKLAVTNFFEGRPIYKIIDELTATELPNYLTLNQVLFYKDGESAITYPCFKLSYNNWDDYTFKTTVSLEYWRSDRDGIPIGYVKIMSSKMEKSVWDVLPSSFATLSFEFCSFSNNEEYYQRLKTNFPTQYHSILHALRDAGIFPRIAEQFEETNVFRKSLIRDNEDEKLFREIRFKLAEIDIKEAFKFRYDFKPPYAENGVDIDFNFVYGEEYDVEHRIYVLIGKNGTGKTRILSGIAEELSRDNSTRIGPVKPLYSKIFTLSYSIFDRFDIQKAHSAFNYVYCGLKKNRTEHLTEQELRTRFLDSVNVIWERGMSNNWHNLLSNFIGHDVLELMFTSPRGYYKFNTANLNQTLDMLSSGQHILIYVLTELFAQIRNDSLILYDEPETHLHPSAISQLMNSILGLVKEFKSFCIIGTHSPLVVQCIQSRDVYILNRSNNDVQLRVMEKESYGENLTVITDEIFGNKQIEKDYLLLLQNLIDKEYSYLEIIEILERDNQLPVNLNIRLYLKSLLEKK